MWSITSGKREGKKISNFQESNINVWEKNIRGDKKQALCKHLENNAVIAKSQHSFVKNVSHQTNFSSFFNKVTTFSGVDECRRYHLPQFHKDSVRFRMTLSLTSC